MSPHIYKSEMEKMENQRAGEWPQSKMQIHINESEYKEVKSKCENADYPVRREQRTQQQQRGQQLPVRCRLHRKSRIFTAHR